MDKNLNGIRLMMLRFLAGEYDPLEFSFDFPDYLVEHYDEMAAANPGRTDILNDELPEICADYERGEDPAKFIARVQREYERAFRS